MLAQQRQRRSWIGSGSAAASAWPTSSRVRRLGHDDPPRPGGPGRPRPGRQGARRRHQRVGPGSTDEPGFAAKSVRQRAEKAAIAAAPPSWSRPGTAIALSAGTTTGRLAQRLVDVPALTVVTNSIPVADVFYRAGRPDQTVVLTGGDPHPVRRAGRPGRGRRDRARCTWTCCSSACTG